MLCRQFGNRMVISFHPGERRSKSGGAHVDGRHAAVYNGCGNFRIFNAGNDAIAVPAVKPVYGNVSSAVFGEVDRPGMVFVNVGHDPA